jgi:hypothetical protein
MRTSTLSGTSSLSVWYPFEVGRCPFEMGRCPFEMGRSPFVAGRSSMGRRGSGTRNGRTQRSSRSVLASARPGAGRAVYRTVLSTLDGSPERRTVANAVQTPPARAAATAFARGPSTISSGRARRRSIA